MGLLLIIVVQRILWHALRNKAKRDGSVRFTLA